MTTGYALIQISVMAAVILLTRVLPFLLFPGSRKQPKILDYFSRVLPYAVMGMLVVYCFRSVSVSEWPYGLPEGIAALATAGIHVWKRNVVLSLTVGTVLYMLLIRTVFSV